MKLILFIIIVYVFWYSTCAPTADASPRGVTTTYADSFADWRIRVNTHVPDPTYGTLYDPAAAAHWRRVVAVWCHRRTCHARVHVWDTRTRCGEIGQWTAHVRRYRDRRVRGGLVELMRLTSHAAWEDVPMVATCS
jgi:hypothetical protein